MIALCDASNFYCSCEQLWRPELQRRPVIVLSNNDGCAVARSDEAKALGIAMGEPWFQIQRKLPDAGVIALSANFVLYGDMSNRMMAVAAGLGPAQEIYSIDESFISLDGVRGDLTRRGHQVRDRILQWTGLPCGIGIGTTKTLAKLANHIAKSAYRKPGSYPAEFAHVCDLAKLPSSDLEAMMQATTLDEVWGIGRRIAAQLQAEGLRTVLDVVRMDPATVRRRWSVVLERTVRELQGQACISLDDAPANKQQIACTRSFGHPVIDRDNLVEAVTDFSCRAAQKLRKQSGLAAQVLVFIHTSPFRANDPQYSNTCTLSLRRPTADSAAITSTALRALDSIYRPGYKFAKAGVMLLDLQPDTIEQQELDLDPTSGERTELMGTLDRLNDRYGRGTITLGTSGTARQRRDWQMRQSLRTPHYTTSWEDIPIARA